MKLRLFFKAARADFLPVTIIPFFIGAAYALNQGFFISLPLLMLGLIGVCSTSLSANLINNYFDYESEADNQVEKISSFFGGSRMIRKGIYTKREILNFSLILLFVGFFCGFAIFAITRDPVFLAFMIIAGVLAVEYTAPPLKLAYNRLGELDIFILFGIGLVIGSFYLFSGKFTFDSFLISLPISFLVAAIIICNEVPDFKTDINVGKRNLLSLSGVNNGYILYGSIIFFSLVSIFLNITQGILPKFVVFIVLFHLPGVKALFNLKNGLNDTGMLIQASLFTIIQHSLVGIATIITLVIS